MNREFPLEMPIFIDYRPSLRLGIFNTLIHFGTVFCLLLTAIPLALAGLVGTCVLVHYVCYARRYLRALNGRTRVLLKLDKQNRWQLIRAGGEAPGEIIELDLLPGTLVHPLLVALRFKDETGRIRACVVTPDNLDKQTLRRLRVRLRFPLRSPGNP